ncbi:unnamed protein product [Pedinophyceae sp. YPF-701]|nr:unnamed protein product [Pedinophyceae sp. YPF-701]
MAYNLYHVQLARAWAQRVEKENSLAEKFWLTKAVQEGRIPDDAASQASASSAMTGSTNATGFSSKTSYLKTKLGALEQMLQEEAARRANLEKELQEMRGTLRAGATLPAEPAPEAAAAAPKAPGSRGSSRAAAPPSKAAPGPSSLRTSVKP